VSAGLDLTGEWAGVYSYPHSLPHVSFTAFLVEREGWLTGRIEEAGRSAEISGRRSGLAVTFLKTYRSHDVDYIGEATADGVEISGRWSLFEDWSGTFLMVRRPQPARARVRQARVGFRNS
jgi:hypothetical protein